MVLFPKFTSRSRTYIKKEGGFLKRAISISMYPVSIMKMDFDIMPMQHKKASWGDFPNEAPAV